MSSYEAVAAAPVAAPVATDREPEQGADDWNEI